MNKIVKQISTIVFLLYFIGVTTGVNLSLHFCEGKVADMSLMENTVDCHAISGDGCHSDACHMQIAEEQQTCKMLNFKQCCSDKQVYIALEASSLFSSYNFSFDASIINVIGIEQEDVEVKSDIMNLFSESHDVKISYPPPYLAFQKLIFYS